MAPFENPSPSNSSLVSSPGFVPFLLAAGAVVAAVAHDRKDGFLQLGFLILAGFLFLSSAVLHAARKG